MYFDGSAGRHFPGSVIHLIDSRLSMIASSWTAGGHELHPSSGKAAKGFFPDGLLRGGTRVVRPLPAPGQPLPVGRNNEHVARYGAEHISGDRSEEDIRCPRVAARTKDQEIRLVFLDGQLYDGS